MSELLGWLKDLGLPASSIAILGLLFFVLEKFFSHRGSTASITVEERKLLSADELTFRTALIEQVKALHTENMLLRVEIARLTKLVRDAGIVA